MTPSPDELAAQYAQMSETELMELAHSFDGLLEIAQAAFARRGLEPPLVEEPEEWKYRRLVTVRRYRDLPEAYVARSLLESAGIPAWVADENLVRMDWFYSNMVGGMRLQVDERDEAAARQILEEAAPKTITYDEEKVYVQPTCPKCGSTEITLGGGTERGRSLVALYLLAVPVPPRKGPGIARHAEQSGQMQGTLSCSNSFPTPRPLYDRHFELPAAKLAALCDSDFYMRFLHSWLLSACRCVRRINCRQHRQTQPNRPCLSRTGSNYMLRREDLRNRHY